MVNPGHLVRGGTELTTMEVFSKDSFHIVYNIEEISVFHINEHNFFMTLTNLGNF